VPLPTHEYSLADLPKKKYDRDASRLVYFEMMLPEAPPLTQRLIEVGIVLVGPIAGLAPKSM
jgi:hypothetical protein